MAEDKEFVFHNFHDVVLMDAKKNKWGARFIDTICNRDTGELSVREGAQPSAPLHLEDLTKKLETLEWGRNQIFDGHYNRAQLEQVNKKIEATKLAQETVAAHEAEPPKPGANTDTAPASPPKPV